MLRRWLRPGWLAGLTLLALAAVVGCTGARHGTRFRGQERSLDELRAATGWLDVEAQTAMRGAVSADELLEWAVQSRASKKPATPFPKKNILVVSGGGVYGAYSAGVLSGWTESGTRPEFDVVTGISTGALVGAFAFLGPAYDGELRRYYTTKNNDDIFKRRHLLASILSESIADSAPLSRMIAEAVTEERIAAIAAEHRKGRRLYVGTSDLETRRAVVWDIGAIATRGTPADRELIHKIFLATASIPGFFPPVRIPVTVDGVVRYERHIDGNTSSSMFFTMPYVPPQQIDTRPPGWLHDSDLYMLVSGKLYADPSPVKARTFRIASSAVSTILYDQTRSDLHKLFLLSALTGMNYNLTSIPADLAITTESTDFNTVEMTRMFEAGAEWARTNRKWRHSPPGYEPGEGARYRSGSALTDTGRRIMIGPNEGFGIPGVIPEKK